MKDILIIPDQHAHPDHNNDRADWLGKFILDRKPDLVVNMGDAADMPSLSGYDKGKASFHGNSYEKDINSHLDFQDRLWHPIRKAKKKQPQKVILIGNHENRLRRVLEYDPHLAGDRFGVSFKNYAFDEYYHEQIHYEGQVPGIYTNCGISFAHYFTSGAMARPISSVHHAYALIAKNHCSCVAAHSHTLDLSVRTNTSGEKIMGLVCGIYQDYETSWAGNTQRDWWRGIVYLRNAGEGSYDPEFISLGTLRGEYQ